MAQLRRSTDDRKVSGLAAGVARAVGVDPVLIRLAFVVLTLASGVGLVLYVLGWALVPAGDAPAGPAGGVPLEHRQVEQAAGVAMVTVGLLLLLRRIGLFFPDELIWPTGLVGAGAAVMWSRSGGRAADLLESGRSVVVRLCAGALLVAIGVGTFVSFNERLLVAGPALLALLATMLGAAVFAAPWILRLVDQLAAERRERIRSEERAEMAAHLHDSVLQTLALIQRRADQPAETINLARRQERELRAWLFGAGQLAADTLGAALRRVVDDVEADHPVAVELVVVGDAPVDDDVAALVAATRETVLNAAKHAGVPQVSVYVEVTPADVTVFVRDRGRGFDPGAVDGGRRGLAESVVGRMRRHGGSVEIASVDGAGTEITLSLPRRTSEDAR